MTRASDGAARPVRGSKALTIQAIEASANEIFCRDGYDRASLREIAEHAGVSLSSIHEYFDSKTALYISVGRRLFERLERQRLQLLERALLSANPPVLETLLHCMVAPVILPEFTPDGERAWGPQQMRTWYDTATYLERDPELQERLSASAENWIELIVRCAPSMRITEARLAYKLIISAMFSWASTSHYFDETLHIENRLSPADECQRLTAFIAAGVRALAESNQQL